MGKKVESLKGAAAPVAGASARVIDDDEVESLVAQREAENEVETDDD